MGRIYLNTVSSCVASLLAAFCFVFVCKGFVVSFLFIFLCEECLKTVWSLNASRLSPFFSCGEGFVLNQFEVWSLVFCFFLYEGFVSEFDVLFPVSQWSCLAESVKVPCQVGAMRSIEAFLWKGLKLPICFRFSDQRIWLKQSEVSLPLFCLFLVDGLVRNGPKFHSDPLPFAKYRICLSRSKVSMSIACP